MNQQFQKSECPAATGQNAEQSTDNANLPSAEYLSNYKKRFPTLQAKFALKGHALQKITNPDNGSISYLVSNWGQSRAFSNCADLSAFLDLIGGAA